MLSNVILEISMTLFIIKSWKCDKGLFIDLIVPTEARPIYNNYSVVDRLFTHAVKDNGKESELHFITQERSGNNSLTRESIGLNNSTFITHSAGSGGDTKLQNRGNSVLIQNLLSLSKKGFLPTNDNENSRGENSRSENLFSDNLPQKVRPQAITTHQIEGSADDNSKYTNTVEQTKKRTSHFDKTTLLQIILNQSASSRPSKADRHSIYPTQTKHKSRAGIENGAKRHSYQSFDKQSEQNSSLKTLNRNLRQNIQRISHKVHDDKKKSIRQHMSNKARNINIKRKFVYNLSRKSNTVDPNETENAKDNVTKSGKRKTYSRVREIRSAVDEAEDLAYLMQGETVANKEKMQEMIASDFSTPEELDKNIITDPKSKQYADFHDKMDSVLNLYKELKVMGLKPPETTKPPEGNKTEIVIKKKKHKRLHGLAFIEATWGPWGDWSDCTAQCRKAGFTVRRRTCDTLPNIPCEGNSIDVAECKEHAECKATWQPWTDWGPCTVTCGEGVKARTRTCNTEDIVKTCKGKASEFHTCKMASCLAVEGNNASATSALLVPYQINKRPNNNNNIPVVPLAAAGATAGGAARKANGHYRFSAWTRWSACSKSCGNGNKRRARQCRDVTKKPPLRVATKHCGGGLTLQNRMCVGQCGAAAKSTDVGVVAAAGAVGGAAVVGASGFMGDGSEALTAADYDVIQEEMNSVADSASSNQVTEEEEDEEDDDSYLTAETIIFIILILLSMTLFIVAFCICIAQRSQASKMKSELRALQPFYKDGGSKETSDSGGDGKKRFRQIYSFDFFEEPREPGEKFPTDGRDSEHSPEECEKIMKCLRGMHLSPTHPSIKGSQRLSSPDAPVNDEAEIKKLSLEKEAASDSNLRQSLESKQSLESMQPLETLTPPEEVLEYPIEFPEVSDNVENAPQAQPKPPQRVRYPRGTSPKSPEDADSSPNEQAPKTLKNHIMQKTSLFFDKLGLKNPTDQKNFKSSPFNLTLTEKDLAQELYDRIGLVGDADALIRSLRAQRIRIATKERKNKREKLRALGRKDLNLRALGQAVKKKEAQQASQAAAAARQLSVLSNAPHRRIYRTSQSSESFPVRSRSGRTTPMMKPARCARGFRRRIEQHGVGARRITGSPRYLSSSWLSSLLTDTDKTLDDIDSEMDLSLKSLIHRKLPDDSMILSTTSYDGKGKMTNIEDGTTTDIEPCTTMDFENVRARSRWRQTEDESTNRSSVLEQKRSAACVRENQVADKSWSMASDRLSSRSKRLSEEEYDIKKNAIINVMKETAKTSTPQTYDSGGLNEILDKIEKSKCSFTPSDGSKTEESSKLSTNKEVRKPSPFSDIWYGELNRILGKQKKDEETRDSDEMRTLVSCPGVMCRESKPKQVDGSSTITHGTFTNELTTPSANYLFRDCAKKELTWCTPRNESKDNEESEFNKLLDSQIDLFKGSSLLKYPPRKYDNLCTGSEIPSLSESQSSNVDNTALTSTTNKSCVLSNSFLASVCEEVKQDLQQNISVPRSSITNTYKSVDADNPSEGSFTFQSCESGRSSRSFYTACSGTPDTVSIGTRCVDDRTVYASLSSGKPNPRTLTTDLSNDTTVHDAGTFNSIDSDSSKSYITATQATEQLVNIDNYQTSADTTSTIRSQSVSEIEDFKSLKQQSQVDLEKIEFNVRNYQKYSTTTFYSSGDESLNHVWSSCHSNQASSEEMLTPRDDVSFSSNPSFQTEESESMSTGANDSDTFSATYYDESTSTNYYEIPNYTTGADMTRSCVDGAVKPQKTNKQTKSSKLVQVDENTEMLTSRNVESLRSDSNTLSSSHLTQIDAFQNSYRFADQMPLSHKQTSTESTSIKSFSKSDETQPTGSSTWTAFSGANVKTEFLTPVSRPPSSPPRPLVSILKKSTSKSAESGKDGSSTKKVRII